MKKAIYQGTWDSVNKHIVPKWYNDSKFGIFIHWGLYSVPAFAPLTWQLGEVPCDENWFANNPYAEWYYNSINIGEGPAFDYHKSTYGEDFQYEEFADMWKAQNWNPNMWSETFKKAGAKYVVLVTKHHDGFCLFPSKYTNYSSVVKGPNRDIVGDLQVAVESQGLKFGCYYSGIIDWRYSNDPILHEDDVFYKSCPTFEYADYAYNQVCELIDNYKPAMIWNDIGWPTQATNALPYLLAHYYNTVEDGVVNDRFNGLYHDFITKEYKQGESSRSEKWEMCRGLGLSFGYNAVENEEDIMTPKELIKLLLEVVSENGNLLINIGPKADGTIPEPQVHCLLEIGKWLDVNGEGIYDTRCSEEIPIIDANGTNVFYTQKADKIYLFVEGDFTKTLQVTLPRYAGEIYPLDINTRCNIQKNKSDTVITVFSESYDLNNYAKGFVIERR